MNGQTCLSVDDVVNSAPLNVIGQFGHDLIGCKTHIVCQQSLVGFDPSIVSQFVYVINESLVKQVAVDIC